MHRYAISCALIGMCSSGALAQDLDALMKDAQKDQFEYTTATFKGTRIINGHSIESPAKGVLQSMFSHRFGTLEDAAYTFLGMNQASIRFGFDYGITDKLAVGVGRSSGLGGTTPPPTYDGYLKYKVLRQSNGGRQMPVTMSVLLSSAIDTERWPSDGIIRKGADRFAFTGQLLIARKFNETFSLQLMPTILHRNLTSSVDQANTLYGIGAGGRIKLSKRTAITAEYYFNTANALGYGYYNPIAIGYEVDTGGHIFQIMLTNSSGLIESQFLGTTTTNFFTGPRGMRIGFNFSRVFNVKKNNRS
jgi:hypothetical protein